RGREPAHRLAVPDVDGGWGAHNGAEAQRVSAVDASRGIDEQRWPGTRGAHQPAAGLDGAKARERELLRRTGAEVTVAGEVHEDVDTLAGVAPRELREDGFPADERPGTAASGQMVSGAGSAAALAARYSPSGSRARLCPLTTVRTGGVSRAASTGNARNRCSPKTNAAASAAAETASPAVRPRPRSASAAAGSRTRKDSPPTPVSSASWAKGRASCWVWPRRAHGAPPSTRVLSCSRSTQAAGVAS